MQTQLTNSSQIHVLPLSGSGIHVCKIDHPDIYVYIYTHTPILRPISKISHTISQVIRIFFNITHCYSSFWPTSYQHHINTLIKISCVIRNSISYTKLHEIRLQNKGWHKRASFLIYPRTVIGRAKHRLFPLIWFTFRSFVFQCSNIITHLSVIQYWTWISGCRSNGQLDYQHSKPRK